MIVKLIREKLFKCPRSMEDQVIDRLKAGDPRPFIEYFSNRDVHFITADHRHMESPSGRVVYQNDLYSYILIDGTWVGRMFGEYDEIEQAVMSNISTTIHYKAKKVKEVKKEFDHKEMLYFMAEHSGSYHYMKNTNGKWSALDCRKGLTFICRDMERLEDAVQKAKEYHDSKTK